MSAPTPAATATADAILRRNTAACPCLPQRRCPALDRKTTAMPILDPQMSVKLSELQTLDDAIAYRLGRLSQPCPDCGPAARCPEHHHDEHLMTSYQNRYATAFQDALAGMDPDDIALIMQPGDNLPPTAGAMSLAVLARLRELAADGPVVIELDGPDIIEHPLQPGSGDSQTHRA